MVVEAVFSVIAEGTRRDILEALATEHKAVGQLVEELGVSQPTVSKHLRVLREAGLVTMRAQGQKRFYSINTQPLALVAEWLDGLGAGVASTKQPAADTASAKGTRNGSSSIGARDSRPAAAPSPVASTVTPPSPNNVLSPNIANGAAAVPYAAASGTDDSGAVAPRALPPGTAVVSVSGAENDPSVQAQISRSVGRAANKAADLLANLPAFRRRKE